MPEVIVALGESKRIVGRLRFETDGRRQHSQFEYAAEWLSAPDHFALSPGLPLRGGSHYSTGRDDRRSALSGCFADAAPDSWGRALMTKAQGGGLSEFDYLVLSDDRTRQGALRFLGNDMEPLIYYRIVDDKTERSGFSLPASRHIPHCGCPASEWAGE